MTMLHRPDPPARWSAGSAARRGRRWLLWAALVSVALHAAVLAAMLVWIPRRAVIVEAKEMPATVQLVMSPPGSDHDASASPPQPEAPSPAAAAAAEHPPAPAGPQAPTAAPADPEQPAPPHETTTAEHAVPPAPTHELTFDMNAVESDTNALVTGDLIVPASPDIKFHNRKPSYPLDAARRGEQGAVILLIHVAPDGLVSGADVLRSSGFALLDQSARDAVLTWHFLPSVKDGQPVPADVPMRFMFDLD